MNLTKLLLSILTLVTITNANVYDDFYEYLKNEKYFQACKAGKQIFIQNERDENLLSIIGQTCLKADYIYVTSMVQSRLRESKDARNNAVIFSATLLQKRLIYQFMYDNADISTLALPVSNHPLSNTFVAIRDNNYTISSASPKIIEFKKDEKKFKVYIDFTKKGRVVIEETDKNNKIIIHRYL